MKEQHDTTCLPVGTASCSVHVAMIEQIQADLHDLKEDMREMRTSIKADQIQLWTAMSSLRESITGNSREGLSTRVDRNTRFRRAVVKLLLVLFAPLYGGLIALLLKTLINQ